MPAKPVYRAAIIGCGNIGSKHDETKQAPGVFSHAGAYREVKRTELIAAADIDRGRLEEFARFWGVDRVYEDYREMLRRESLDIVSLCTWDATHYDILMGILESRAPRLLFAEKPLATSSGTEIDILRKAEEKGTKIVVNYQRRWEPEHQLLAREIREGAIGEIQAVSAYYVKGIRHIGCTVINTLRFLIGEMSSVLALPPDKVGSFPDEDPSLDAVLFFVGGPKAVVQSCDKGGYTYSIFEIDIVGSRGRIRILENGEKVVRYRLAPYRNYPGFMELKRYGQVATQLPQALVKGVQEMVEILDQDLHTYTNHGLESYRGSLVLEAIALSRRQGGAQVEVGE